MNLFCSTFALKFGKICFLIKPVKWQFISVWYFSEAYTEASVDKD